MIGVFDSGFGGLMLHRALTDALPQLDFAYLGDKANAPYGPRPAIDVLTLACVGVDKLFALGCNLVIIADNTSAAVALDWMQQQWLPAQVTPAAPRNVLGVVAPAIEAALADKPDTIAVFATERTVESNCYPLKAQQFNSAVEICQQACPTLVALIEEDAPLELVRAAVHKYVGQMHAGMGMRWPDRVILGCTHYPLIANLFEEILPPDVLISSQRRATAISLKDYLRRHPEYPQEQNGRRLFFATGDITPYARQIEKFWGASQAFEAL